MHGIIWCYWLLLPWDQIGYWAVKIVTGVPDAIPVIGGPIVELLRGGGVINFNTFLQSTYFCFTISNCCVYVNALLND
jgi:quinol-cytochrome oxidoreductase complex cytochrome b subunit